MCYFPNGEGIQRPFQDQRKAHMSVISKETWSLFNMKKAYLEPEILFLKLHFTILLHLEMQDLVMKVVLNDNYTLPEEKNGISK